jgi:hypothetical protein
MIITALVFCGAASLCAQAIPKALLTAKTVYVVNEGAYPDARNDVAKELLRWGRFKVVNTAESSDLTITINRPRAFEGMPLTITDSKTKAQLWYAAQKNLWGYLPGQGRLESSAALVRRLRERLERK